MHRYNNIEFVLNLEFETGVNLIKKAIEEKEKSKAWDMWLIEYQFMVAGLKEFRAFSEYFKFQTTPIEQKSKEEILDNVNKIIEMSYNLDKK